MTAGELGAVPLIVCAPDRARHCCDPVVRGATG
ncbi:hypothetical protein JOF53_008119 [Crossiella equi]|uniref:Uncharacterized protein n=1 Tax=Crossiella equi TaxID=130796 RepID=A0ABS5AS74_9PSEU|nr:hypothetical protein [Crossiella equi]